MTAATWQTSRARQYISNCRPVQAYIAEVDYASDVEPMIERIVRPASSLGSLGGTGVSGGPQQIYSCAVTTRGNYTNLQWLCFMKRVSMQCGERERPGFGQHRPWFWSNSLSLSLSLSLRTATHSFSPLS